MALVGRSNVGKSSLINALAHQRIARSGGKPGTTRLLNLYRFSFSRPRRQSFFLVDLPGYGYARGGDTSRREFETLVGDFFDHVTRSTASDGAPEPAAAVLAAVLLVVDARHPGLDADVSALQWLAELGHPILAVATKTDRLTRSEQRRAEQAHARALGREVLLVSARTGDGIPALWAQVRKLVAVDGALEGDNEERPKRWSG